MLWDDVLISVGGVGEALRNQFSVTVNIVGIGHSGFLPTQDKVALVEQEIKMLWDDGLVDLHKMQFGIAFRCGIARFAVAVGIEGRNGVFITRIVLRAEVVGVECLGQHFDALEFLAFGAAVDDVSRKALVLWLVPHQFHFGAGGHLETQVGRCFAKSLGMD